MTDALDPSCRTILANISAYLDGELDATAWDDIDRHCQTCTSCRTLLEGLSETVGLCRRVAEAPLPQVVRERARDSVCRLLEDEPK